MEEEFDIKYVVRRRSREGVEEEEVNGSGSGQTFMTLPGYHFMS